MSSAPISLPIIVEPLSGLARIVSAYVANNAIATADLPDLIKITHQALQSVFSIADVEPAAELKPAVPIKKSITPEFIICLEDGKQFRSMKRHLSVLGMTPDEYRAKWGLPSSYPMVSPNYAKRRSGLAKANGLGRKTSEVSS